MSGRNQKLSTGLEQDRQSANARTDFAFGKATQDTPELQRYRQGSTAWDLFKQGGDFSKPPPGSLLNYNLSNPARIAEQGQKLADLEGVGASSMAGQGDNSIAVQQSRHKMANQTARDSAAAYQDALAGEDSYYRGSDMNVMNSENARWGNLFGQTSANQTNATKNWVGYEAGRPNIWGQLLGGALGLAGSYLGRPR